MEKVCITIHVWMDSNYNSKYIFMFTMSCVNVLRVFTKYMHSASRSIFKGREQTYVYLGIPVPTIVQL